MEKRVIVRSNNNNNNSINNTSNNNTSNSNKPWWWPKSKSNSNVDVSVNNNNNVNNNNHVDTSVNNNNNNNANKNKPWWPKINNSYNPRAYDEKLYSHRNTMEKSFNPHDEFYYDGQILEDTNNPAYTTSHVPSRSYTSPHIRYDSSSNCNTVSEEDDAELQACILLSIQETIIDPESINKNDLEEFQKKRRLEIDEIWEKKKSNYVNDLFLWKQNQILKNYHKQIDEPFLTYLFDCFKKVLRCKSDNYFMEDTSGNVHSLKIIPFYYMKEIWKLRIVCKIWLMNINQMLRKEKVYPLEISESRKLFDFYNQSISTSKWKYVTIENKPFL